MNTNAHHTPTYEDFWSIFELFTVSFSWEKSPLQPDPVLAGRGEALIPVIEAIVAVSTSDVLYAFH